MFGIWDYVGIDTYEGGPADNPGPRKPADRIYSVAEYLSSRGYTHPIGVGEYNGFSATTIAAAGEALLATPDVWFGILWNAAADVDWVLSGDRLAAFQQTLRNRAPPSRCERTELTGWLGRSAGVGVGGSASEGGAQGAPGADRVPILGIAEEFAPATIEV